MFVQSSPLPTQGSSQCGSIRSMLHQMKPLGELCKKIHGLVQEELQHFDDAELRLKSLPDINHSASYFKSLKVNETLPQLYEYTQSLRLHLDWLKIVKENVSLPFQSEEAASSHLGILSDLVKTFIPQQNEEALQSTTPQLPVVSDAFDALLYAIEISDRLKVFCDWSKESCGTFRGNPAAPDFRPTV